MNIRTFQRLLLSITPEAEHYKILETEETPRLDWKHWLHVWARSSAFVHGWLPVKHSLTHKHTHTSTQTRIYSGTHTRIYSFEPRYNNALFLFFSETNTCTNDQQRSLVIYCTKETYLKSLKYSGKNQTFQIYKYVNKPISTYIEILPGRKK